MQDLIDNIISVYGQATATQRRNGLQWYKRARKDCRKVAKETGQPLRYVAGVVAATSPNLRWEKNVHTAKQVINAYVSGQPASDIKGCMAYPANRIKAYSVLAGANRSASVLKTLNGPKVSAFFDNILGGDSVTIDGHARNIAYNDTKAKVKVSINKGEYAMLVSAYRAAAALLGLRACELQAITWVVWRNNKGFV